MKEPKYKAIAAAILQEMEGAGGRLTKTQMQLARQFGVNRLTLRHALDWLEREGQLKRLSGRTYGGKSAPVESPKSRVIGFPIWADAITSLEFSRVEVRLRRMQDIHRELAQYGYTLDAQFVGPEHNPNFEKIQRLCQEWTAVILEPWEEQNRIPTDHPFMPIMDRAVFIGTLQDVQSNCVCPDLYAAGQLAVEEFVRLGVRRILYTGGPDETAAHRFLRIVAVETAAGKHGLEFVYAHGGFHAEETFSAIKRYFLEGGQCDGILAGSTYAARGALRALADLRIDVPGQMQFITIGGNGYFTYSVPRPTMIAGESGQVGAEVARMAVAIARDGKARPNILTPLHLIQGETTRKEAFASAEIAKRAESSVVR